jgi:predicted DNA-binding protein (MmcQ/YjbR family)
MTREELIEYCKNKKGVTIEFPFDDRFMSFKLISKFMLSLILNMRKT